MSLFPLPQQFYRVTGMWLRGEWKATVEGPLPFKGTIQPINAKDMKQTPDARQDVGQVTVYTRSTLNVAEQGTDHSGDHVLWEGKYWEIIDKLPHTSRIISHNQYIAAVRPEFTP